MTPRVLLITGTCGVGKTSVAEAWATKHSAALIEGDSITRFIASAPYERYTDDEQKLVGSLSARAACEFLDRGMPVVLEWVLYPATVRLLRSRIRRHTRRTLPDLRISAVWLTAGRVENHSRDKSREASLWMNERVDIVAEDLERRRWPRFVQRIDSSGLSVAETVASIDALCW